MDREFKATHPKAGHDAPAYLRLSQHAAGVLQVEVGGRGLPTARILVRADDQRGPGSKAVIRIILAAVSTLGEAGLGIGYQSRLLDAEMALERPKRP